MCAIKEKLHKLYIHVGYFLRCSKVEDMTLSEAKKILDDFYPRRFPRFQQKVNYNPEYDLMIIVPVYNTEDFLDECIQSLIKQNTKYSYKIVFVDDGSTDRSKAILDSYSKNTKVKIVHKENSGIAGARNTALRNICARYIMFVDSDDLLEDNAVELLMDAALAKNADVVEGTHIEFTETKPVTTGLQKEEVSGYPWGKVISAEKMINLCFPEGYMYEDTIISTLLIPSCKIVCTIPNMIYYYRKSNTSITAMLEKKKESIDTVYMTYYCFNEALNRGYKIYLEDFLHQVRLNWLRTQGLPSKIQKAIFVWEIEMLSKLFDSSKSNQEGAIWSLEKVLRKHSFCAYEWLMNSWQVWDA